MSVTRMDRAQTIIIALVIHIGLEMIVYLLHATDTILPMSKFAVDMVHATILTHVSVPVIIGQVISVDLQAAMDEIPLTWTCVTRRDVV